MTNYPAVAGPDPDTSPALKALLEQLLQRHGEGINAALLYGSCLRSGDIFDGLLDVYLICDRYRSIYSGVFKPFANWLLPPNVFYTEVEVDGQLLRCKYSVISSADFSRGCSTRAFESYIWGRFAQPVKIIYGRDQASREQLESSLASAAATFLRRSLPVLAESGSVSALWENALAHSYATELRTERAGRANELALSSQQFFEQITRQVAGRTGCDLKLQGTEEGSHYQCAIPAWRRRRARLGWSTRRLTGKLMSVLRLVKALFTFDGGLDYIAWKLERHSGRKIEIPERVRRYPLIFLWGYFWGLYREGIFK